MECVYYCRKYFIDLEKYYCVPFLHKDGMCTHLLLCTLYLGDLLYKEVPFFFLNVQVVLHTEPTKLVASVLLGSFDCL